jgi:hypothetical protein
MRETVVNDSCTIQPGPPQALTPAPLARGGEWGYAPDPISKKDFGKPAAKDFSSFFPFPISLNCQLYDARGRGLARIMHYAALFCTSGELARADIPSGEIGVRQLVMQRVRG